MLNRLKMLEQPNLITSALGADAQQMGVLRLGLELAGVPKKGAGRGLGIRSGSPCLPLTFHDTVAGTFSITAISE
jgi:hypothetical protein